MYIIFALLSAFFAGITAILAKCGIQKTNSNVATAIRTIVVLIFSWIIVLITGAQKGLDGISAKSASYLVLSGIATGASWLCYFKALSKGNINKIVPIDKSSVILTVLFAIIFLGERQSLALRFFCLALIGIGTYLMIEKKEQNNSKTDKSWFVYALLSALFAALQSILAKIGVDNVDSNLATALRTAVVLIMAWIVVFVTNKQKDVFKTDQKELVFIVLSAFATGASWLCYYRAMQMGNVSVVVPIDKLSIVFTVAFSYMVFKEKLAKKAGIGLAVLVIGTLMMTLV